MICPSASGISLVRLSDGLQFSAEFSPATSAAKIQGHQALGFQNVRTVAGNNALREAFHNRGFAHAGSRQHGIVLVRLPESASRAISSSRPDHRVEF